MKVDPTKIAKLAQQIAQNKANGQNVKEATTQIAKETIKTKLAAVLSIKVLPIVLAILLVGMLIWFLVYATSKTAQMINSSGGTACVSQEEIQLRQDEISEMEDEEAKKAAEDELNNRISQIGICEDMAGGAMPEGVTGGINYDQKALDVIVVDIKDYLDGKVTTPPDLEIVIQQVKATIDAAQSGLSVSERNKKKTQVEKKIRALYNDFPEPKAKWGAIYQYLKKERGMYLWKAEIGNTVVAAVRSRINMPYILGNRRNWDHIRKCYDNSSRDDAPGSNVVKGCGFDCSSLASYGAAVGNRKSTGLWQRGSDRIIQACEPYNSTICPYNTTVSGIAYYGANGPFTLLPSAAELAPGDFVLMSYPGGEQNFHVAIYVGRNAAGQDLYVESPRPGLVVRQRESWWGNLNLKYVRPYATERF